MLPKFSKYFVHDPKSSSAVIPNMKVRILILPVNALPIFSLKNLVRLP